MKNRIISIAQDSFALNLILSLFAVTALSGCAADDIPDSANSKESAYAMELHAEFQQVRRFDCENKIVSDQREEVESPTNYIEINPATHGSAHITMSDFVNTLTHSRPALLFSGTKFTIDYHNHYTNMWVRRGVNEIKYNFTFDDGKTEMGSRFVDITYTQVDRPGLLEVRPTTQDCAKPN